MYGVILNLSKAAITYANFSKKLLTRVDATFQWLKISNFNAIFRGNKFISLIPSRLKNCICTCTMWECKRPRLGCFKQFSYHVGCTKYSSRYGPQLQHFNTVVLLIRFAGTFPFAQPKQINPSSPGLKRSCRVCRTKAFRSYFENRTPRRDHQSRHTLLILCQIMCDLYANPHSDVTRKPSREAGRWYPEIAMRAILHEVSNRKGTNVLKCHRRISGKPLVPRYNLSGSIGKVTWRTGHDHCELLRLGKPR